MAANLPADLKDVKGIEIIHVMDNMGHTRIDAADFNLLPVYENGFIHPETLWIGQPQLNQVPFDLCINDPGAGFKGHLLSGDSF